ncbi:MAG TPA: hypothetical protein VM934_18355 [Pyrinomonadaceae bacterium]|jgi:hypothetical protein|nr:hypothetical protein [Pyrinomonadaceae bacterium]
MIRINLECAFVAALAAAWPVYMRLSSITYCDGSGPLDKEYVKQFLSLLGYPLVALALALIEKFVCRLNIPGWMFVSIFGTIVSITAVTYFDWELLPSRAGELKDLLRDFALFGVYTSLLTAPIYYSEAIITALKRWRNSTFQLLGISRGAK